MLIHYCRRWSITQAGQDQCIRDNWPSLPYRLLHTDASTETCVSDRLQLCIVLTWNFPLSISQTSPALPEHTLETNQWEFSLDRASHSTQTLRERRHRLYRSVRILQNLCIRDNWPPLPYRLLCTDASTETCVRDRSYICTLLTWNFPLSMSQTSPAVPEETPASGSCPTIRSSWSDQPLRDNCLSARWVSPVNLKQKLMLS